MAISELTSGQQTATLDEEHVLHVEITAGVFQLKVDTTSLALGERLELRIKTKVRSSDADPILEYMAGFEGPQTQKVKASIPVTSPHEIEFTLKQIGGTGRAFNWSVVQLA